VSGSNPSFEALETSFHQDLNGDGTIGIAGTTLPAAGQSSFSAAIAVPSNDGFHFALVNESGAVVDVANMHLFGPNEHQLAFVDHAAAPYGEQGLLPAGSHDAVALLHLLDPGADHFVIR
jgi:hypothetical protein